MSSGSMSFSRSRSDLGPPQDNAPCFRCPHGRRRTDRPRHDRRDRRREGDRAIRGGLSHPPGLKLRDEIGRSWRIAEALWGRFTQARSSDAVYAATQAFVDDLLRQVFSFVSLEAVASRAVGDRVYPVRRVALGGRVPVAVAAAGAGLDHGLDQFTDERRKRSAKSGRSGTAERRPIRPLGDSHRWAETSPAA